LASGLVKKRDGSFIGTPPGSNVNCALFPQSSDDGSYSGWSIENGNPRDLSTAPDGSRRSVYFFEVHGKMTAGLADLWLNSVCDDEQDRRDGFGLSLWGTW
jgi:hypothetical protein